MCFVVHIFYENDVGIFMVHSVVKTLQYVYDKLDSDHTVFYFFFDFSIALIF